MTHGTLKYSYKVVQHFVMAFNFNLRKKINPHSKLKRESNSTEGCTIPNEPLSYPGPAPFHRGSTLPLSWVLVYPSGNFLVIYKPMQFFLYPFLFYRNGSLPYILFYSLLLNINISSIFRLTHLSTTFFLVVL